jgi:methylamine dehydrogenase accessory protein MauD
MELWIASLVVLWVVVLVVSFLLAGALRQIGIISLRLGTDPGALITQDGIDRGAVAPDIHALDLASGVTVKLSSLPLRARVIVFLSSTCSTCRELLPHLQEVADTRPGFDFVVVCQGPTGACESMFRGVESRSLRYWVDESGFAAQSYQVSVTPFAYVIDYTGRVLIRGIVNTWPQLDGLLDQEGTLEPSTAA